MAIDFDVVIESGESQVDMKSALDSLQGVSDALRYIGVTVLTGKCTSKLFPSNKVRTDLKHSFKGSYGQVFSLNVYDEILEKEFKKIGKVTFSELVHYFVSESLYLDTDVLSEKALKIINTLGSEAEKLVELLRNSSIENVHTINNNFGHPIKLRHRINRDKQTTLAYFDDKSILALTPVADNVKFDIEANITRLNIKTGNGRLRLKGEEDTISFGFGSNYREVRVAAKKRFSANLDYNNGIHPDRWQFLKLQVTALKLKDGRTVKFLVTGIYDE